MVRGLDVPVIMRLVGYKRISLGECYVGGFMEGEGWRVLKEGISAGRVYSNLTLSLSTDVPSHVRRFSTYEPRQQVK